MINLKTESVRGLSGVGEKTAALLEGAGICTLYDLLCTFPRAFEDHTPVFSLSEDILNKKCALLLRISSQPHVAYTNTKKRVVRFSARLSENSPLIHLAFFNQPYLLSTFHKGDDWLFFGTVKKGSGGLFMFSPSYEKPSDTYSSAVPVYSNVAGLGQKKLAKIIGACLDRIKDEPLCETLPEEILIKEGFPGVKEAFFALHRPENEPQAKKAAERFAFEEMYDFSLAALRLSKREDAVSVKAMPSVDTEPFISSLPFKLTGAQLRSIEEIKNDLTSPVPCEKKAMKRLLQGDVGSGKTAVAAAAMYIAAKSGAKSVMMAPTEILARQHCTTLTKIFSPFGIDVLLLTGSSTTSARREIEERLISDTPLVLVGTHALFESPVIPKNLKLVIVDEQHRFGVNQREKLLKMASSPNYLVMSATPIPRTLAMFLYAGLDISVLDEKPVGRQEIETFLIPPSKKERMYSFIKGELEKGAQGYVICPLVEKDDEDEESELLSAEETAENLSAFMKPYRVGLLHGKMKPQDKKEVMSEFEAGEIDLLVSTTVVEVGVDVPRATVMAIENAERFGLAQLHQLRGRIGRGDKKSTCILITPSKSKEALERLWLLCHSNDGFEIAEYDLKVRGPGDFFGDRQHGELPFTFAESFGTIPLFHRAMEWAKKYNN